MFRDSRGQWKSGPAAVFSKAVVAGLAPPEFKLKVQSKLDMMGGWKDKPDNVLELIREAAIDWRTVEQADKRRGENAFGGKSRKATPSAKSSTAKSGARGTAADKLVTCFVCKKPGHVSDNCPVRRFPATSQQSGASARGGQQQQQQQ